MDSRCGLNDQISNFNVRPQDASDLNGIVVEVDIILQLVNKVVRPYFSISYTYVIRKS